MIGWRRLALADAGPNIGMTILQFHLDQRRGRCGFFLGLCWPTGVSQALIRPGSYRVSQTAFCPETRDRFAFWQKRLPVGFRGEISG